MNAELWLFRGQQPVPWTVPFWVTRKHGTLVTLVEAPALLAKQKAAVRSVLKPVADWHKGRWILEERMLPMLAERLPEGTDPDAVTSWGTAAIDPPPVSTDPVSTGHADMDEFLDSLLAKGVGASRADLAFWWLTFCKHAQDYLLNKEKPIPMYFIKLHPSPYRRNWKWVLLTRFPRFWRSMTILNPYQRRVALEKSEFIDEMLCLDLLAMHKRTGFVYRYVEVEHERTWYENVRTVERERLRRLGWTDYAGRVMASVRRRLDTSIRLYGKWLADLACPSAQDVECGESGEFRLAPNFPPTPVSAWGLRTWFVPAVVPNKHPSFKPANIAKDLYPADPALPDPVPSVSRAATDLRTRRANVGQPFGLNGAPRVLVPYSDEGNSGANDVLALLEYERQSWLARGPERPPPKPREPATTPAP